MNDRKALLLSVRPQFAEKIFNGTKKVELRRTKPNVQEGDLIYIYVSSPTKSLMGVGEVSSVVVASPVELWDQVSSESGMTQEQFSEYFSGVDKGFGIKIRKIHSFTKPIHLDLLRKCWGRFYPPQIYQYLSDDDIKKLNFESCV